MDDFLHHTQTIITAVDEFDFLERIKPSAVMEYFQDLATVHATEIGIGYEEMKEKNLCWVLNRLSAVVERMPAVGEPIVVTTYPHKPGIVDAFRDYYITDTKGNGLIRGTSRWCVLDIRNKAIRRCAPLFSFDDSQYNPEYAVADGNPQLPELNSISSACEWECTGKVRITDLDRNGHMNNARYADIVVNSCDFDFYSAHKIASFDFNFLSEAKIGDEYRVRVKTHENVSYFEANKGVNSCGEQFPMFRAKITWA